MGFGREKRIRSSDPPVCIGRNRVIRQYLEEFNRPSESARLITSIYGIGGIGKSTLLNQFMSYDRDRTLYSRVDELSGFGSDGKKLIQIIGEKLCSNDQQVELPTLAKQLARFEELLDRIAKESDESTNSLGEWLLLGTRIGVGVLAGDAASEALKRAAPYIGKVVGKGWEQVRGAHRLIRNPDEREMLEDPLKALTKALVLDLNNIASRYSYKIVLMFDTYEQIGNVVDKWLLDYLIPTLAEPNAQCDLRFVMAGRKPLGQYDRRWLDEWHDYILFMPIDLFDQTEIGEFLVTQCGITDPDEETITKVRNLTSGYPLLLARWIQSGAPIEEYVPAKDIQEAAKRLMWWFSDEEKFWIERVACCRWFDVDFLAILLAGDRVQAQKAYECLTNDRSITEITSNGKWKLHDTVQTIILEYLRPRGNEVNDVREKLLVYLSTELKSYKKATDNKSCFTDERFISHLVEFAYYGLLTGFRTVEIKQEMLEYLLEATRYNPAVINSIRIILTDKKPIEVRNDYIRLLTSFVQLIETENWTQIIVTFSDILKKYHMEDNHKAIILCWIGTAYRKTYKPHFALPLIKECLRYDENYHYAIIELGIIYLLMGEYESAIAALDKAISLDPLHTGAIASRGETYRQMQLYEKALIEFNKAIELGANIDWVFSERAETFRELGDYKNALQDLDKALEIDPKDSWSLALKVRVLDLLGRSEDAKAAFEKASKSAEDEYAKACVLAIAGRLDDALGQLEIALRKEQRTKSWARHDPDLIPLHSDERFVVLTQEN